MNLKEAFRFQNKLQSMMADAQSILGNNGNITKVQNTYLRHKVMAEAEDEVTMEAPSTEYSENITEMAEFLLFLLDEREKLSAAIHQAKASLPLDAGLDGEVSLNGKRQEIATLLRHMAGLRNGEVLISNGGVYKWQQGKSLPSVDNLYALGALFEVPMEDILVSRTSKLNLIICEQQAEACCSPLFMGELLRLSRIRQRAKIA